MLIYSGIKITNINNPFGGVFDFTQFNIDILGNLITPLPYIITFIWILWLINLLSWSNGVDGQYSGIITVAGLTKSFLALRFSPLTEYVVYFS
jgi:UDP-N-acetylmuramyl pentapeptide phosphotransferase/UDP-N-acetylglucosamine-1-phosphate transferase